MIFTERPISQTPEVYHSIKTPNIYQNPPTTDLLVVSPSGKHFAVDVKGQSTRNFWLVGRREPQKNHFYVLVYLPKDLNSPKFFVLNSKEIMDERRKYEEHIKAEGRNYRDELGGINWSTAFPYESKWDKLPK